jgi:hypothetical protein
MKDCPSYGNNNNNLNQILGNNGEKSENKKWFVLNKGRNDYYDSKRVQDEV